ncbi:hypothetical protein MKW94_010194, partial [Papaver nudicaule]|nr:hypothetical protein [Papaver nudicaule]
MHNRVGNFVPDVDESVPKKVRLLKELDLVELGPSKSDERCAKKPKRLSKGKASKDKKDFFKNFRTNLQITKQDTNAVNDFTNQGGGSTIGSLLNSADFTILLEPEGVLGTD